jgi:RNA-binding protein
LSTTPDIKTLRTIAHTLHPVVTVAEKGLSETVQQEIARALQDHELIKVRVLAGDRAERQRLVEAICERENAALVQRVGHVAVLYRANPKPDPKLSSILRHRQAAKR